MCITMVVGVERVKARYGRSLRSVVDYRMGGGGGGVVWVWVWVGMSMRLRCGR